MTRKQAGALPAVQEIAAWLADQDGAPRTTEATQAFGIRGMENRRAFKALYKDARKLGRDGANTSRRPAAGDDACHPAHQQ